MANMAFETPLQAFYVRMHNLTSLLVDQKLGPHLIYLIMITKSACFVDALADT